MFRAYALPHVAAHFAETRAAIKRGVLSGRPGLDRLKRSLDAHVRAGNLLAEAVAAPAPLRWSPPPRKSFALIDFARRMTAVRRDPYAAPGVRPAGESWSWFVRGGHEVPLPK